MGTGRRGLTLIEIVVVIAVILILAAAMTPTLVSTLRRDRITAAVDVLQDITDAMSEMRKDNQDWPGRLTHLSQAITTSERNVCGSTYSSGKVSNWAGPYFDRVVAPTGLPIGIGTAKDTLYRSSVSGQDGLLTLEVSSVNAEDAIDVNTSIDNDGDVAGRTTGTVQWSTPTDGLVTLFYYRPIRGC